MLGRSGISYGPRGYSTPRSGVFSGRPQSVLSKAFARNGVLRHIDWLLILVVCGLSALGVLLVWSATQPGLNAQGDNPHTYLEKQLLNVIIGFVLMIVVTFMDSRRLRSWTPAAYGLTVLALLAVLTPLGQSVTGPRPGSTCPAVSRSSRLSSPSLP